MEGRTLLVQRHVDPGCGVLVEPPLCCRGATSRWADAVVVCRRAPDRQPNGRLPRVDRMEFELGDFRRLGPVAHRFPHRALQPAFDEPVELLA